MNGFFRSSRSALAAALAVGIAALAATPAVHAQGATNARLPSMTTIKSLSVPYFALEFIAAERDLFKKYNLDVEFVTQVAQGSAGIPAIVAGHVQTGQGFGVPPILQARAGGARVTAVYAGITSTYGDFRFYTLADSGIKTAKQLAGKSFGINNFGTYADIALLAFLAKDSVDVSQVRRLTVPLPSMCQALLSKQVDAVAMYSLFYVPCEKENAGKVVVLAKDSDAIPAAAKLYSAYVFADDYIRENPGVVRAYIAGMRDAADYVNKNPDAARDIIAKRTKIPADKIVVPTFAKNGCIDTQAAAEWVKVMVQHKAMPEGSASATNWVNNSLNGACN
jgi:ABC-type nitrate/sulfonate/bicarbonate transport system substrate-binding protein